MPRIPWGSAGMVNGCEARATSSRAGMGIGDLLRSRVGAAPRAALVDAASLSSQPPTANRYHLSWVGTRRRRVRPKPTVATPSRPYLIPPPEPLGLPPATRSAVSHLCTFAQELRSDLHLCTASCSLVHQASEPPGLSFWRRPPAARYFAYASFAAFWNSRRISLWSEFLRSVRWMSST